MTLKHDNIPFLMPEKSSSPWRETFYIPPGRKGLSVVGVKSFTFHQAEKVFLLLK
jgi:hypothetical protein